MLTDSRFESLISISKLNNYSDFRLWYLKIIWTLLSELEGKHSNWFPENDILEKGNFNELGFYRMKVLVSKCEAKKSCYVLFMFW